MSFFISSKKNRITSEREFEQSSSVKIKEIFKSSTFKRKISIPIKVKNNNGNNDREPSSKNQPVGGVCKGDYTHAVSGVRDAGHPS